MKRNLCISILLSLLFLTTNLCLAEERPDLTGTWEGLIYVPEIDIDMEITLSLIEENGLISGRIRDDWGYLDCDITDPRLSNNILTFKALVVSSRDEHQMAFRMTITGERMQGQWESLGSYGEWWMEKRSEEDSLMRKEYGIRDIIGVWKGPAAYKSDPGSKNILTLRLQEREGVLHGVFSDQFGTNYKHVKIIEFIENRLTLEITFSWNNNDYVMEIDLAIKDDLNMRGKFRIPKMGRTGIWKAGRGTSNE